jgi:hypothetical protein
LKNKVNYIRMVKKELEESGLCAVHYAERLTNGDIRRELAATVNILPKSFYTVTKSQDTSECQNLEKERMTSVDTLLKRFVSKSNILYMPTRGVELSKYSQGIRVSKEQVLLSNQFSCQNGSCNTTFPFLGKNHTSVKSTTITGGAITKGQISISRNLSENLWALLPMELCLMMQSKP